MNKGPLVSVIVLNYNNDVIQCLKSLLTQEYNNFEVIINDDGSANFPTGEVNDLVSQHKDINIRININTENIGTVKSINNCLKLARCEYIKLIGADDKFYNGNSLTHLVKAAVDNNSDVTIGKCIINNNGQVREIPNGDTTRFNKFSNEQILVKILKGSFVTSPSVLIKRSVIDKMGQFDENARLIEDWPAWIKLLKLSAKFYWINTPCIEYALGGISQQKGKAKSLMFIKDYEYIYKNYILPEMKNLSFYNKRHIKFMYKKIMSWDRLSTLKRIILMVKYIDVCLIEIFIKQKILKVW